MTANKRRPSTGFASCSRPRTRTRPHILRVVRATAPPIPRMLAWLLPAERSETRRGVASASYSPTVADARRDTRRVVGPVRPQPATAIPEALSAAAVYFEIAPTGVAVARLVLEGVGFHGSLSVAPRRLNESNRTDYRPSRRLAERTRYCSGVTFPSRMATARIYGRLWSACSFVSMPVLLS